VSARIVHDGWVRKAPALSGGELRDLETRADALAKLKRDLHVTQHDEIHRALRRAHETRDVDATRAPTATEIAAARDASEAMRALLERLTPERPVVIAPIATVAVAAPEEQRAFALTAPVIDRSAPKREGGVSGLGIAAPAIGRALAALAQQSGPEWSQVSDDFEALRIALGVEAERPGCRFSANDALDEAFVAVSALREVNGDAAWRALRDARLAGIVLVLRSIERARRAA